MYDIKKNLENGSVSGKDERIKNQAEILSNHRINGQ